MKTKIPTVYELRKRGFKVRVTHVRKFYRFDPRSGKKTEFFAPFQSSKTKKRDKELHPESDVLLKNTEEFFLSGKGGETIIEIASSDHKELGKGVAECSEKDSYVKSFGVKKAIALALKNMKDSKDPYFNIRKFFLG